MQTNIKVTTSVYVYTYSCQLVYIYNTYLEVFLLQLKS